MSDPRAMVDIDGVDAKRWGRALLLEADLLVEIGQQEQATRAYARAALLSGNAADSESRQTLQLALYGKAHLQAMAGAVDEAVVTWRELVSRFASEADAKVRHITSQALTSQAMGLAELGRLDEAVTAGRSLAQRFTAERDPDLLPEVTSWTLNTGATLDAQGRCGEAAEIYKSVADRLAASTEDNLRVLAGHALFCMFGALGRAGREQESAAALHRLLGLEDAALTVLETIAEHREGRPTEELVVVLWNRILPLDRLGRAEDAMAASRDFVKRFAQSPQAVVQDLVKELTSDLARADRG